MLNCVEFLKHMQCAKPNISQPIHDCVAISQAKMIYMAEKIMDPDDLLPAGCCVYIQSRDCVLEKVREVCGAVVDDPEETADYISERLSSIVGDAMDMLCGRYDNLENCNRNLKHVMKEFDAIETNLTKRIEAGEVLKLKTDSFLMPIMDMMARMGW